jgi:2-succinyl-5-enolpyruvyl-6-hydroxy-3-cyclohexene-1-carboxylate synthase
LIQADPALFCAGLQGRAAPPAWATGLLQRDKAAETAAEAACVDEAPFEGALLRRLFSALPEQTPVFLANSLTIRAAEWFGGRDARALKIFGNRGLSGIDGNLSTALGISAALGGGVAVLGDLAFLHDLNALSLMKARKLTVLLLDNRGGGIFDHLAQASLPEFERAWITPQAFDPAALAKGFGLRYTSAQSVREAVAAVAEASASGGIVHVAIDRAHSLARCRDFFACAQMETCS